MFTKTYSVTVKFTSDDGKNIVIRPLAFCSESDIKRYAEKKAFPIIPCDLCGSQDNLQRQAIKQMLGEWRRRYPGRVESIFRAMQNIVPSHLADADFHDFDFLLEQDSNTAARASWLV